MQLLNKIIIKKSFRKLYKLLKKIKNIINFEFKNNKIIKN